METPERDLIRWLAEQVDLKQGRTTYRLGRARRVETDRWFAYACEDDGPERLDPPPHADLLAEILRP